MNKKNSLLYNFVDVYNRIEEMNAKFNRSRLHEYTELCAKMNRLAVEIVRTNACDYELTENNETLVFDIDNKDYNIPFDDLISLFEDYEIKKLSSMREDKKRAAEREDKKSAAPQNPLEALMQYFVAPFVGAASGNTDGFQFPAPVKKETSLLDDINAIQKKVILLEEKSKNISANDEKVSELESQVATLTNNLNALTKEKAELEELYNMAVEESEQADSRIKELENKISTIDNSGSDNSAALMDELKDAREEIKRLKAQISAAPVYDKDNNVDMAELERYKSLAFTDRKYDVMNANAYYDFIENSDKDGVVVAVCGISNTKQVNQLFGRKAGDNMIGFVAKTLVDKFGRENVYRVYGDQFIIFVRDMSVSRVKDTLSEIKDYLFTEDISVSYGSADAVACDSLQTAVKHAEGDMNSMKSKDNHKHVVASNLEESVQKSEDISNTEKYGVDDVDVLSKTTVQRLGEPEISADTESDEDDDDISSLFDLI